MAGKALKKMMGMKMGMFLINDFKKKIQKVKRKFKKKRNFKMFSKKKMKFRGKRQTTLQDASRENCS